MSKNTKAELKEFHVNQHGISIVKCCASCKHHEFGGTDSKRACLKRGGKHAPDYLCGSDWEMIDKLDNAGRGGGRVKKKSYIEHTLREGVGHRFEFEILHGSVYLDEK